MTTPAERQSDAESLGAEVRPLSRVAQRPCARPGCPAPARATLTFSYARQQAWLEPLRGAEAPEAYDLCSTHASRTRPPHGWAFRDRRPAEDRQLDAPPVAPRDLGGERTVAVLAAALRAVPDIAPESGARRPQSPGLTSADAGAAVDAASQPELLAASTVASARRSPPEDASSPVLGADQRRAGPRPPLVVRASSR